LSLKEAAAMQAAVERRENAGKKSERKAAKAKIQQLEATLSGHTLRVARELEEKTGLEARVTILGHLQRGGTPSAGDRLLATRLGAACAQLIEQNVSGVMVAARGDQAKPVALEKVAGNKKLVPTDHPWVQSARLVGTSLGD
jgi:6-phosphofructokinase 1